MFLGKHADLTEKIIGAFYKVYRTLGYGFLENVYENALVPFQDDFDIIG